jgi:hypothetical protein
MPLGTQVPQIVIQEKIRTRASSHQERKRTPSRKTPVAELRMASGLARVLRLIRKINK